MSEVKAELPKDGEGVEHFSIQKDGMWMYNAGTETYCDLIAYPNEFVPLALALLAKAPEVTDEDIRKAETLQESNILRAVQKLQITLAFLGHHDECRRYADGHFECHPNCKALEGEDGKKDN